MGGGQHGKVKEGEEGDEQYEHEGRASREGRALRMRWCACLDEVERVSSCFTERKSEERPTEVTERPPIQHMPLPRIAPNIRINLLRLPLPLQAQYLRRPVLPLSEDPPRSLRRFPHRWRSETRFGVAFDFFVVGF